MTTIRKITAFGLVVPAEVPELPLCPREVVVVATETLRLLDNQIGTRTVAAPCGLQMWLTLHPKRNRNGLEMLE